MAILIPEALKVQIDHAAISAYPLECCGLMLGQIVAPSEEDPAGDDRWVAELVHVDNRWDISVQDVTDPQAAPFENANTGLGQHRRYWIDPEMMLKVQRQSRERNLNIVGVYHSHPNHLAEPSECDRRLAWPVYSYVIISVQLGETLDFRSWRLDPQHQFQGEAVKIIYKI